MSINMDNSMSFLNRAIFYTELRNDDNFFRQYYTQYREYFPVRESVYKALAWLYNDNVALFLETLNDEEERFLEESKEWEYYNSQECEFDR